MQVLKSTSPCYSCGVMHAILVGSFLRLRLKTNNIHTVKVLYKKTSLFPSTYYLRETGCPYINYSYNC